MHGRAVQEGWVLVSTQVHTLGPNRVMRRLHSSKNCIRPERKSQDSAGARPSAGAPSPRLIAFFRILLGEPTGAA
jgi:hypothetical protein